MELNPVHPNVNKPYSKSYYKKQIPKLRAKKGFKTKYWEWLRLYQQSKMRFDYILTEKLLLLMSQRSSPSPLYTFFALRFGNYCL